MRARRQPDVGAIASAVSRPGIDPRQWIKLASVEELGFDPLEGVFADLLLLPEGVPDTALVGSTYAGAAFGDWCPLEVGDLVVVAIPDGDSGSGPVVIARCWNAADPPHPDFGDGSEPSQDRVIRSRTGRAIKLRTSGTGAMSLVAEGAADAELTSLGGIVQLGAAVPGQPAADAVALAGLTVAQMQSLAAAITTLKSATNAVAIALDALVPGTSAAFAAATSAIPLPVGAVGAAKVRAT